MNARLDVTRLRALWMLARCGTIAAAADTLNLTASAVSQQLAQLEADVGIALTERRGRGVRLTKAGELLVKQADRLMNVLDEAWAEVAQLRNELSGELRVAAFSTAAALLPDVIKTLRHEHPQLDVVVEEMEPWDAITALRSWSADIAFVHDLTLTPGALSESVVAMPILADRLYALLPKQHRLASKASVGIGQLKQEDWVFDSSHSAYGEFIIQLCWRSGFEPRVKVHCRGHEMVVAMVASNCAVSVVPGLRLVRPLTDITAVPLRPTVQRKIAIAYRKGEATHPAVSVFVDTVQRALRALEGSDYCIPLA